MTKEDTLTIHAYIDGELSADEKTAFEEAMLQDDKLKQEVCELRKIKQQIVSHYQKIDIPPLASQPTKLAKPADRRVSYLSFAASLFVAVGFGFMLAQAQWFSGASQSSAQQFAHSAIESQKVLMHIDSNDTARTGDLLKTASALLENAVQNDKVAPLEIQIIANHDGIELFEEDSRSREAIVALLAKYDNLKLIACQRALERRANLGKPVDLIKDVQADRPAIDVIIDRMQSGWGYHKF